MNDLKGIGLIADSNVMIDYLQCDSTLISLINNHLAQLYLPTPLLGEVEEITEDGCIQLGIKLIEPELEQIIQASQERGALSFQDNLCLILAKENGWTLVTNDKALRRRCEEERIPIKWGIELICILVESGGLSRERAKIIILKIQEINPRFITDNIVEDAFKRLNLKGK